MKKCFTIITILALIAASVPARALTNDEELKYGLSVTGFVHPQRVLANRGLLPGDCLVLTKPLGVGIVNTAVKGGLNILPDGPTIRAHDHAAAHRGIVG